MNDERMFERQRVSALEVDEQGSNSSGLLVILSLLFLIAIGSTVDSDSPTGGNPTEVNGAPTRVIYENTPGNENPIPTAIPPLPEVAPFPLADTNPVQPSGDCRTEPQFFDKVQRDVEREGQMEPGWRRSEQDGIVEWCPPKDNIDLP